MYIRYILNLPDVVCGVFRELMDLRRRVVELRAQTSANGNGVHGAGASGSASGSAVSEGVTTRENSWVRIRTYVASLCFVVK